ncbi:MAG: hypothetical protein PHV28_16410 [Kiritimatiellae bacterium]|nr:hypothetical protein [Kiritimatiellia bacterium]
MTYVKIPQKDAVLLIRALGLLISQSGVYGPSHKVTQSAARSVYAELAQTIAAYGPVEIALNEKELLVNGSGDGIGAVAGKNLADRMALHKIGGLVFLSPPDLNEFLTCVTLLGTQPFALTQDGGFEGAVKKANLRSVQVVTVAFQRVSGDTPPEQQPPGPMGQAPSPAPAAVPPLRRSPLAGTGGVGVLDLSAALEPEEEAEETPSGNGAGEERKRRVSSLASLLRETAALLESNEGRVPSTQHQAVIAALEQIRTVLAAMTVDSEHHIATLANQVDDDRQTIASIESAARRRGIGLKLTRGELVQRYAELNQEIVQPLTVSTGVIGMLKSERTGTLTPSQRELLKMAEESVGRVNQLVSYMNRISGLPDTYTPDARIIADSYRQ